MLQILLTLCYCGVGFIVSFPLSYYFQGSLFSEMSLMDYIRGGITLLLYTAEFGALVVYQRTLIVSIIGCLLLCKLIERQIKRKNELKKTSD